MTRYLISGAAGFIGSNLVERLLTDGHDVVGVDNMINGSWENIEPFKGDSKFSFVEGDLCSPGLCEEVCEGVDYVLHQAALGSVPRSVEDPATTMRNNVMSTVNLLVAAEDAGVKRFVYASSASVYGNSDAKVLDESMPTAPFNPYAASKLAAEDIVRVFHRTYGLPTICLRYFNVFGPRQNPDGPYAAVVPSFITSVLSGRSSTIYGDGEQARDFTYVDNVVETNLLACEDRKTWGMVGEVFNVAAGGFTTVNTLFGMVLDATGIVVDPVYTDARAGDVRGCRSDIEKAKSILGYKPNVNVAEGIKRTVEWYREKL